MLDLELNQISIIIPTLNEIEHIEKLIDSISSQDNVSKEIFIVDGGSDDGTQQKVRQISQSNPYIKLIENPERFVSHGFNRAYRETTSKYISLIGAHSIYPNNYFYTCIKAIQSGECDVAGGFLLQIGKNNIGKAIARVMSSQFGVGNTEFRTIPRRMYVDSVAFAIYDRRVFDKIGLFDEELIRNQDDEFHYRLTKAGFKILMLPELEITYIVRSSLKSLFNQYYQYGLYKPLVFIKVNSGMRLRHLIPPLFVLYLFSLPLSFWQSWWLIPFVSYCLMALYFGFRGSASWEVRLLTPIFFPVLHVAYGLGFLKGIWKWRK